MFLTISSGIGHDMWVVILGRAVSGMGGAGTMTVSSIIITGKIELQFKREVVLTVSRYCSPARSGYLESVCQYCDDSRAQSRWSTGWMAE